MKLAVYMPIGKNLEMFKFSTTLLFQNAGFKDWVFIPIVDSYTSKEVMDYIKENEWEPYNAKEIEGDWYAKHVNLWNEGYNASFNNFDAEYVIPTGADHAYYFDFLKYLMKYAKPNRIVNCKLIEPGLMFTVHTAVNFGFPTFNEFQLEDFYIFCKQIWKDELITDEKAYGRRLDAMPMVIPRDVWERFGPMKTFIDKGKPHDVDFFDRAKEGGVENTKSLGAVGYHWGLGEKGHGSR